MTSAIYRIVDLSWGLSIDWLWLECYDSSRKSRFNSGQTLALSIFSRRLFLCGLNLDFKLRLNLKFMLLILVCRTAFLV
jgi:hypothetical protein